jgi:hypothetical protein
MLEHIKLNIYQRFSKIVFIALGLIVVKMVNHIVSFGVLERCCCDVILDYPFITVITLYMQSLSLHWLYRMLFSRCVYRSKLEHYINPYWVFVAQINVFMIFVVVQKRVRYSETLVSILHSSYCVNPRFRRCVLKVPQYIFIISSLSCLDRLRHCTEIQSAISIVEQLAAFIY